MGIGNVGRSFVRHSLLLVICAGAFASARVPASASELTAPIEQLDAGLVQAMKTGKATTFQQRYELLGPLIMRAF
jgi:hypothetical protein